MADKEYFNDQGDPVTFRYVNGHLVPIPAWNSNRELKRAAEWYSHMVELDSEITQHVKMIAESTDTNLIGLEMRIKSQSSYDEKYERKSIEKGKPYTANDVLRYTHLVKEEEYVLKYKEIVRKYEEMGYNLVEVDNHWLNTKNPYNGINAVVKTPQGDPFEIQFHHKESYRIKELQHSLYDKQKEALRNRDMVEYLRLNDELGEYSRQLKLPKNIEKVRNKP